MPKLWNDTIETHRRAVREAVLETAATLVQERGLKAVTMSQIAEETGIGRATLYKYFPDVESILFAWHERKVADHLVQLHRVREGVTGAAAQLETVLTAYAFLSSGQHGGDIPTLLHRGPHLDAARQDLERFVRELLFAAAAEGAVRDDVPVDELAAYCISALEAAAELGSVAAVHRLVTVVLAGIRPQR